MLQPSTKQQSLLKNGKVTVRVNSNFQKTLFRILTSEKGQLAFTPALICRPIGINGTNGTRDS